jgi:hypothetical protein
MPFRTEGGGDGEGATAAPLFEEFAFHRSTGSRATSVPDPRCAHREQR